MPKTTQPIWYMPDQSDDTRRIAAAITASGIDADILHSEPMEWCCDRPVVYYGTIEGMKQLQSHIGAAPSWVHPPVVNWCDWDRLRCVSYYTQWGQWLLNQRYGFYPLAEVRRLADRLWSWYYSDVYDGVFVRPDANDKCFDGMLVKGRDLRLWLGAACRGLLNDTLCVVARSEPIKAEYRLVVADGKVITASKYMEDERLVRESGCPLQAIEVAEIAATEWSPHRIFCIDVAYQPDGVCRIIECASVHTCGFYACDLDVIVRTMTRMAADNAAVA